MGNKEVPRNSYGSFITHGTGMARAILHVGSIHLGRFLSEFRWTAGPSPEPGSNLIAKNSLRSIARSLARGRNSLHFVSPYSRCSLLFFLLLVAGLRELTNFGNVDRNERENTPLAPSLSSLTPIEVASHLGLLAKFSPLVRHLLNYALLARVSNTGANFDLPWLRGKAVSRFLRARDLSVRGERGGGLVNRYVAKKEEKKRTLLYKRIIRIVISSRFNPRWHSGHL